jgi:UDP-N-acetylmuramate: L-alanyl-gamma-D-glutamyl-meso-diaminopimelate ligase
MQLHILGICGTFMSGVALLAKQSGHTVIGSDEQVYPPMNVQLAEQGIQLLSGYDPAHIDPKVDAVIVGNVIKRGNPAMEYVLAKQIPYLSGPQWLAENILPHRWVLAVAGTHGKTTTASLLAWVLHDGAGVDPGFLIGGVPGNFDVSARLGRHPYFVIEADEYDAAFFDKRSKFLHYRPKTLVLNNLEFDHADIFSDLQAIKQQCHHLVRTVPNNGLIAWHGGDQHLADVLAMGCWTPTVTFGSKESLWQARLQKQDGSVFTVMHAGQDVGEVRWDLLGRHNVDNALATLAAAQQVGVTPEQAIRALCSFKSSKRRMEMKGTVKGIVVYDDFAHHPTAIAATLAGLRAHIGQKARIIAVLEFGSYTMRTGIHRDRMNESLRLADMVVCKRLEQETWDLASVLAQFKQATFLYDDVNTLVSGLVPQLRAGDHVVIMSNAGFDGIHQKLLDAIERDK